MKCALVRTAAVIGLAAGLLGAPALANTLFFQMNPNFDGQGQRQVFLFGPAGATGTVTGASGFSATFDLGAEGFAVVDIPRNLELGSGVVQSRGFRIESSQAISGYYLSRNAATTDSTYLIDGARLGTDYFALGYQNIREDQVSVQATQDDTVVTFTRPGGAQQTVTLNAGQTFMITASTQLTGTRVQSDKPVAVFSGNNCTNVPTGVSACDHIVEQMPPTDALSTEYFLAQTVRTGTLGNVVRVVATADNTEVTANGTVVATLNTGQFWEGRVAGGVQLNANNRILVGQYLIGQTQANANTDPAMTIVPGRDQWLSSYVFSPPLGTASFANDFIQIVIATSDLPSLLLDGAGVDSALFAQLASTSFSFGNIDVSDKNGRFSISAANPFQLLLMGFQSFDSYFTYGGAAFSPGASPPPDPEPEGNVRFWDGDAAGNPANGRVDGGNGILTATSPNLTGADGLQNGPLPGTPVTVIFSAAPGTVEIDDALGAVIMGGMTFTTSGYRLTGDPITLAGTTATICVSATCPISGGGGGGSGGDDGEGDGIDEIEPTNESFTTLIEAPLAGTAGIVKTGSGTLVLRGAGSYAGTTQLAEGTLIGSATSFGAGAVAIGAGTTLIFDQATHANFANGIGGTGSLVKQGLARLTLTGDNSFSGRTTVEQGLLQVDGALRQSVVTVAAGGTLGGTGAVGGVDALRSGRVAPGASIGTLTVAGNLAFANGSILDVELTSTGATDLLQATGTATIAAGAILRFAKLDAPRFVLGTRYRVLGADGGRAGPFVLSGPTRVSQFISVVGEYDARNAFLAVRQTSGFASVGGTPNQVAAATGVDNPGNGAAHLAIAYLPDAASARAAFDLVSGEIHASVRGLAFEDTRFVREAVASRLQSAGDARRGFWLNGYGAWGDWDGDGNAAGLSRTISGVFFGLDAVARERVNLGILGGFGNAEFDVSARAAEATARDFHLGAYLGFGAAGAGPGDDRAGGVSARAGIANMWRDMKTRRSPAFPGLSESLRSSYDLSVFQVFGDIGYRLDLGGIGVEPFAGLAYVRVSASDFLEAGGSAALRSAGDETSGYWMSSLGGRLYLGLPVGGGRLGLAATGAWRHAGGDVNAPLAMRFASGPAFDISGVPIAEDSALLGAAITGRIGQRVEVEAGYSGQIGGGVADHGVRANLIVRF